MRTVEFIQIIGPLVGGAAAIIMGFEKRLVKRLESHEATSVESAVALPRLRAISRWRLSSLFKHHVVRSTPDGLFYFDEVSRRMLRKRRLTIAIPLMLAAAAVVVLMHAVFG